jgi:hypothetical protein
LICCPDWQVRHQKRHGSNPGNSLPGFQGGDLLVFLLALDEFMAVNERRCLEKLV